MVPDEAPIEPDDAPAFVEKYGIVLETGRGGKSKALFNLAEAVAGEALKGGWRDHARSKLILDASRKLREHPDMLVCNVVEKKVAFVHRRLWPALVRMMDEIGADRLTQMHETIFEDGPNSVREVPFPEWVPEDVWDEAAELSKDQAREQLSMLI